MFDWSLSLVSAVGAFFKSTEFEWFVIFCVLGGIFVVAVIVFIIKRCCCKKSGYAKIENVEHGEEEEEEEKEEEKEEGIPMKSDEIITLEEVDSTEEAPTSVPIQISPSEKVKNVSNVVEASAEPSFSDIDLEEDAKTVSRKGAVSGMMSANKGALSGTLSANAGAGSGTVSAYGDTVSGTGSMTTSVASKASWFELAKQNLSLSIQTSLIYSKDMRYIAGKVIQVDGLTSDTNKVPSHVRIHVVVLPVKTYALKTHWYKVPDNGKIRIEEYFKYVFKLPPSDLKTMFRVRVYGRKKTGSLGRGSCMGECYITLLEIINARGGLTVSRALSRGIPHAILEGQIG